MIAIDNMLKWTYIRGTNIGNFDGILNDVSFWFALLEQFDNIVQYQFANWHKINLVVAIRHLSE